MFSELLCLTSERNNCENKFYTTNTKPTACKKEVSRQCSFKWPPVFLWFYLFTFRVEFPPPRKMCVASDLYAL